MVIWVKYRDSLDMKNNCGRFAHFHRNEMNEERKANARWGMAERIRLSTGNERIETKTKTDVRIW